MARVLQAELAATATQLTSRQDLTFISSKPQAPFFADQVASTASDFQVLAVRLQAASSVLRVAAVTAQITPTAADFVTLASELQVVAAVRVTSIAAAVVVVTSSCSTTSWDPPSQAAASSQAMLS